MKPDTTKERKHRSSSDGKSKIVWQNLGKNMNKFSILFCRVELNPQKSDQDLVESQFSQPSINKEMCLNFSANCISFFFESSTPQTEFIII